MSLREKFEAKISSLEDSKDFSTTSLIELVNALQATEQRRSLMLNDDVKEFLAKGELKAQVAENVTEPAQAIKYGYLIVAAATT